MNKNPKEKTAWISVRAKPKDKERIKNLAKRCGLSVTEYMLKRALGYEPRSVLPDAFFDFYGRLCELVNTEKFSPETEEEILNFIGRLQTELLLPGRENVKCICKSCESVAESEKGV